MGAGGGRGGTNALPRPGPSPGRSLRSLDPGGGPRGTRVPTEGPPGEQTDTSVLWTC